MGKKTPSTEIDYKGDFGFNRRAVSRDQVVGIFDLVGFSKVESNKDLVSAVRAMQTSIELALGDDYWWAERDTGGFEAAHNEVLLRSTGDGYVVAFSKQEKDLDTLEVLIEMYKAISKNHKVNLGINKGDNYVLGDMNDFVNIIGWGVNYAARALQYTQNGQIICTGFFAASLLKTHGDKVSKNEMVSFGKRTIKEANIELFNYYKEGEFGAPLTEAQSKKD